MRRLTLPRLTSTTVFVLILSLSVALVGAASMEADVEEIPACPYCGMDRHKFAHSRMFIVYDDGSKLGTCSLHCAVADMAVHLDKAAQTISVGDFNTKKLIDAEKAYWVIGGDQAGVMTKRAKWAFENEVEAKAFISQHGGQASDLDGVIEAAFDDMYQDTKMIIQKRKMKRMRMEKTE